MFNKSWLLFVTLAIVAALFMGCKDETEPPTSNGDTAFEILTEYLVANNMDLSDIKSDYLIAAADLHGNEDDYYIMDIRSQGDYDTLGHIDGAVHSSLADIVTDAASCGGLPIVVCCYTGQSAAHAVVALRLSGYDDAKSLKFGMSSWNAIFDKWTSNTGNIGDGHTNWSTGATATLSTFDYPEISTSSTDGATILAERVDALLEGGFKGVTATDVLDTPTDYFINNFWAEADVSTYGHIAGAYRIMEDLTIAAGGFANLDPNETIVTYCWTGQTSSIVTAYLTVLGYEAKSLKFGANAMIYDQLTSGKWSAPEDFPYVTTP
ncbi:hypothetical protein DRQ36_06690 [bacterium]|nr:MAG: hypothetical protein DRQ36_06690 [bacterium]